MNFSSLVYKKNIKLMIDSWNLIKKILIINNNLSNCKEVCYKN